LRIVDLVTRFNPASVPIYPPLRLRGIREMTLTHFTESPTGAGEIIEAKL
jgi:hypothetical protein